MGQALAILVQLVSNVLIPVIQPKMLHVHLEVILYRGSHHVQHAPKENTALPLCKILKCEFSSMYQNY